MKCWWSSELPPIISCLHPAAVADARPPSFYRAAPCEGVFANHPAVIMVAATDALDNHLVYGPWNSTW